MTPDQQWATLKCKSRWQITAKINYTGKWGMEVEPDNSFWKEGWKINKIQSVPGQPNLKVGDRIIGIAGINFIGKTVVVQNKIFNDHIKDGAELLVKRPVSVKVRYRNEISGYTDWLTATFEGVDPASPRTHGLIEWPKDHGYVPERSQHKEDIRMGSLSDKQKHAIVMRFSGEKACDNNIQKLAPDGTNWVGKPYLCKICNLPAEYVCYTENKMQWRKHVHAFCRDCSWNPKTPGKGNRRRVLEDLLDQISN